MVGRSPGPRSDEGGGGNRVVEEGGERGTPEGRQKQEARSDGHHGGGDGWHVVGGRGTESANTASRPARRVTSRGGGEESRSRTL